jgi:hypothetical protein
MRLWLAPALCLLALVSVSAPAHAYIDPAAGSLLLQAVIAGVAGLLLTLKLFWRRLTGLWGSKRSESRDPESTDPKE